MAAGGHKLFDYHGPKNWINDFLIRSAHLEDRPVFYDIDAYCPQLRTLELAYRPIREEVEKLLADHVPMPRYHDVNRPAAEISSTTRGNWNVFLLELLGHRPEANRARCPATCAALADIPDLVQAFFSILDPGKSIPKHDGPYVGYLRYHLGLKIPRDDPPSIIVAGQPYTWKEGEGVLFDDSWPHEVVNHSAEPRVVLIVDVARPMPRLPRWVNHAFMWGLAAPTYGRNVVRKAEEYRGELPLPGLH